MVLKHKEIIIQSLNENHNILFHKVEAYGVRGIALVLFKTYLAQGMQHADPDNGRLSQ